MKRYFAASAFGVLLIGLAACTQETEIGRQPEPSGAQTAAAEQPAAPAPSVTFTEGPDGVIDTNVCEIRTASEALDGKKIRVHARYVDINSYAMLADGNCTNFGLRLIRPDLSPSDAVFDHTTEFLENVLLHGSNTFFTDDIDVFADLVGTYHRQYNSDYHVLVVDSVSNITYEEHPGEEHPGEEHPGEEHTGE